jgi:hypothetical protein
MLPTKFRFIWPSGYRGEDFLETAWPNESKLGRKIANLDLNHLQTWPPQAILVSDWPIKKNLFL